MFLAVFLLSAYSIRAQTRGSGFFEPVSSNNVTIGKQWAVFIAIDNYREWGPLLNAVKDAREIKDILLANYRIDPDCVRELYNQQATAAGIRGLFVRLQSEVGSDDSVFIFHAGHGINDPATRATAWIPYDAGENRLAQTNWVSHSQVRDLLNLLNARHVLLVSDSCYSGDLLDANRGIDDPYPPDYNKSSRLIMSSGASEQVKDESEFAARFKNALLRAEGPYITPDVILARIKETQTTNRLETIPILAPIPNSSKNEIGGSFFFLKNNATGVPLPTAGTLPTTTRPTPLPATGSSGGIVTNFTPGQRAGAAILNLALGMGSFGIQKDGRGGAATIVMEGLGAAAVVTSFFLVKETQELNMWEDKYYTKRDTSISMPVMIGGLAAYAVGAIYGVYRAVSYQKPGVNIAEASLPWNIALVPTAGRDVAVRLSYTMSF